jgi:glycosyltransferase involved in cell wall biosynthesis
VNVLFVNEYCGFVGGVEQNVLETAGGLRGRGHHCTLAHAAGRLGRDPEAYARAFDGTRACDDLGGGTGPARLADALQAVRPDVVFIHKVPRLPEPAVLAGTRIVRVVHDHDLCCPRRHKYFAWNGRPCHHPVGWRCYADAAFVARAPGTLLGLKVVNISAVQDELRRVAECDALVVGSRYMREELRINRVPPERIHVLPPMVRMDSRPSPVPREPVVLYVGQLVHGKGVDLLLGALARLNCPHRAVIVGTGNGRAVLERRARRLGLAPTVTFAGWVAHDDLHAYYRAARVVVVPSRWPEPFGMVGLEAMHHARPVVAFSSGGIPDWLDDGETGLLVPGQRPADLARAIERVLTVDALATTLGRNALERVNARFSFESYLDRLECILEPRAAGPRRGHRGPGSTRLVPEGARS